MRSRFVCAALCALSLTVVACNQKTTVIKEGGGSSPTSPTPTPSDNTVTQVLVSTPSETIFLNTCSATITFTATVVPASAPQGLTWASTGPQTRVFSSSGPTATLSIRTNGVYTVTATSTQNGVSGTVTVNVFGDCGGINPPHTPECNDKVDNDHDGKIDYPADPGCSNLDDDDETDTGKPPEAVPSIDLTPNGGSGQVGTAMPTQATCRLDANGVPCGNTTWSSTDPSKVSVNANNGLLTFVAPGTSTICATWNTYGVKDCEQFTATSGPATPITLSPLTLTLYPPACPQAGPSTGVLTANMAATWSSNAPSVASVNPTSGASTTVTAGSPGTAAITAVGPQGQTATATVTVQTCPTTPAPTCSLTPSRNPITSGESTAITLASTNAASSSSNWNSNTGTGWTASVSPTATTTYTTQVSGAGGTSSCNVTITVNPAPSISVNVQPKIATCSVGGQANFGAVVNGTADQRVRWEISNPNIVSQKDITNNTIVLNCLAAGTATVTAKAEADLTKSDSGTVTVSPTTITCDWTTSTGLQSDGSVIIAKGQNISATATCNGATPAWYSTDPSRVGVKTGTQKVINGKVFETGNNATISAVFTGQAQVCVQAAIDQTSPSFCRLVKVQ